MELHALTYLLVHPMYQPARINGSMRFEETPANISLSQMPRKSVLYIWATQQRQKLIDFTLTSNARRFYSSMGNPLAVQELIPFVFAWKRTRRRQPPKFRASPSNPKKIRDVKARKSLDILQFPVGPRKLCVPK